MKKNVGSLLALYPMPATVSGEKSDYVTLKAVLFEFPTYQYLKTGEVIDKCFSFKKSTKEIRRYTYAERIA